MPAAPYFADAPAAILRDKRLVGFDAADIVSAIASFEAIIEEYRGVAYTPRDATEYFEGTTYHILPLGHVRVRSITSVTTDAVLVAATGYRFDRRPGLLVSYTSWPGNEVVVIYSHGYTTPSTIVLDACTEYVLSILKSRAAGVSRNTLSQSDGGGTTRYSTPDWAAGRPTGWLEVDRLLNSLPDERVGLA